LEFDESKNMGVQLSNCLIELFNQSKSMVLPARIWISTGKFGEFISKLGEFTCHQNGAFI